MSNYWSQYWKQGHLTSFGEDIKGNYKGELKKIWGDYFSKLNANDYVIDIGTGNGALIELALQGISVDCKFLGIDYAELHITEDKLTDNVNVSFMEHVAAEILPFEKNSFNGVISQFALEYSDVSRSIVEISRVLKPKGTFQFVCHHEQSTIVLPNNAILSATENIMKQDGAFETASILVKLLSENGHDKLNAKEAVRNKLNRQLADIASTDEAALYATNFPKFIQTIFSKRSDTEKQEIIEQFSQELNGLILRLNDLKKAALTEMRKSELLEHCKNNGLKIETCKTIKQEDGSVLAYQIVGMKP